MKTQTNKTKMKVRIAQNILNALCWRAFPKNNLILDVLWFYVTEPYLTNDHIVGTEITKTRLSAITKIYTWHTYVGTIKDLAHRWHWPSYITTQQKLTELIFACVAAVLFIGNARVYVSSNPTEGIAVFISLHKHGFSRLNSASYAIVKFYII